MTKVDIIMPLYNKARVVERAVESIRAQTFSDWRLIVVDDGSTDGSGDIVRQIDDERIVVVRQENAGPGGARNTGIGMADAEYIAFLDGDDEWLESYLSNALLAIEGSDVAIVGTMYFEWPKKIAMDQSWRAKGIVPSEYFLSGRETAEFAENLLFFFHVGNTLIKTKAAKKADGFYAENNCRFAEDTTFFLRTVFNERIKIIEPAAVCHHREDSNLSNTAKDPLAPFLLDPEVVLGYCPEGKRGLMEAVIDLCALRAARKYARHGYKSDAVELIERFENVKDLPGYRRCVFEIATSRWFKYWVAFKCFVGPRARGILRKVSRKAGLIKAVPDFDEGNCDE